MENQILPVGFRSLCSEGEGTTNLSFVNNPDERTVNLTNASVNIDNSRDVIIGNAIHHYHAPVTIQQITTRIDEEIDADVETVSQLSVVDVEKNPEDFQLFDKKKFTPFNITIATSLILLLIIAIIYFCIPNSNSSHVYKFETSTRKIHPDYPGKPSHSFGNKSDLGPCKIIEEEDWGIKRNLDDIELIHPIPLVIVSHSATPFCENYEQCKARMAQMQEYHISTGSPDIGYNFIIGGDGNLYVGRGWKARNFHWGNHSIGLNFVGNYFRDELTSKMIECAKNLLKYGEENAIFTENYLIVCHNQTSVRGGTNSPGPNVCGEIKTWPHYSGEKLSYNFLYGV